MNEVKTAGNCGGECSRRADAESFCLGRSIRREFLDDNTWLKVETSQPLRVVKEAKQIFYPGIFHRKSRESISKAEADWLMSMLNGATKGLNG